MLTITLPEFHDSPEIKLDLEHSLLSLSKWESKYEKPFFKQEDKTSEETLFYLRQMVVGNNAPDDMETRLAPSQIYEVSTYIHSKQSATWFREDAQNRPNGEIITSELIYYWLVAFNIDFYPTETWHLNRLLNLVKICGIKQSPPKKMDKVSAHEQMMRLNAERKKQLNTSG